MEKEKRTRDKQRSTKHTHKTEDRVSNLTFTVQSANNSIIGKF
jgi:hypothetical protein